MNSFSKVEIFLRDSKDAKGTLIGYHSFDEAGESYAKEILARYEKARKKK